MANWFGLESHPTDEYLHWSISFNDMCKIRMLYCKALEGDEKSLNRLLDYIVKNTMKNQR